MRYIGCVNARGAGGRTWASLRAWRVVLAVNAIVRGKLRGNLGTGLGSLEKGAGTDQERTWGRGDRGEHENRWSKGEQDALLFYDRREICQIGSRWQPKARLSEACEPRKAGRGGERLQVVYR